MRLKFLPLPVLAFTAILFLASCSKKTNTQGRFIPAGAAIVVHVNAASVSAKLPWDEVKQNELFKTMYADSSLSSFAKAALDNPENTGIDSKKDLIFFMVKDSTGGYIAFEGAIKDAAKFKAYNAAALKDATSSEKNGVQYMADKRTTVSWDKDKFIVIADAPEMSQLNDMNRMMNKDTTLTMPLVPSRDGAATAAALYVLAEDKSMAKNEKFSKLVNNKGDIHFWMNIQALMEGNAGMAAMSMVNLGKLYENSFTAGTANFDNGQVNIDMESYAGKEMTELWKKYSGSKISSDMVKRLPAKDIAVFIAMNFKPEGIKEFVKLLGVEGLINMGAGMIGFNVDDFVKANKGDILLAFSDITKDSAGKTNANFLFAATVGDKASFDKLVTAGNKMGKDQLGTGAQEIFYNRNDPYFAIGNKKENVNQFVTKEGSSSFDFMDKIKGGPVGGYVNLQYILAAVRNEAGKDSLALVALDASAKIWKDIILSGGAFKDGSVTQHIEINMVDKTNNSLKQLNTYIGVMSKVALQKKKENKINEIRLPGNFSPMMDSAIRVQ